MNLPFPNGFSDEDRQRCAQRKHSKFAYSSLRDLDERGLDVEFLCKLLDVLPHGCFVAGGAIESIYRGEKPKDYDVYFSGPVDYRQLIDIINASNLPNPVESLEFFRGYKLSRTMEELEKPENKNIRFIDVTCEGKPKIQLITAMMYESPEHAIDTFDFTAAMGAAVPHRSLEDRSQHEIIMHPMMPLDVARKRLVLHRMTFPASTMRRMIKYTHKGYYACPGSLQQMAQATMEVLNQHPQAIGPVYVD